MADGFAGLVAALLSLGIIVGLVAWATVMPTIGLLWSLGWLK